MNTTFHLQQGQGLLDKKDATSLKQAMEHFKAANEMTEYEHLEKPKILYYLALGNLVIGNVQQCYKIAHKAKRRIDTVIDNSVFSINNMREMLGESRIDALIDHIEDKYVVSFEDIEDDDFDENELDFSQLNNLYPTMKKQEIKPQFSIQTLDEDVVMATFMGLARTNNELVYFDKLKGDVLSYVQGYLSSHLGDQNIANRRLSNRIINREPADFIDENRFILIDRLSLADFLSEYQKQTKGKEPFLSFSYYFSTEAVKDYDDDVTTHDLGISSDTQREFSDLFAKKYQLRIAELKNDYINILNNTRKALGLKWIEKCILNQY